MTEENADGSWKKIVKPYPDDIDQWSHYLQAALAKRRPCCGTRVAAKSHIAV